MLTRIRYTPHQVPRRARADGETSHRIMLVKNVSTLRATYQIGLLAVRAQETKKRLVLIVPLQCRIDPGLQQLIAVLDKTIQVERFR